MKILHVTKTFKPFWEFGGVARVSYEMSRHLLDRGHEITVYTIDSFSSIKEVESNKQTDVDGLKTYYFNNLLRFFPGHFELISPVPILNIIGKDINNFDLIHFHDIRTSLTVVTAYYAKKNNIPYIIQAHGSLITFFQKQKLKKIFDIFFGHKILNGASKVIALTGTEADQYKKMGVDEDKIEIVPNGIDLSEYDNLPTRGEFRKKYGIKDDEKVILYIGRLHGTKGIDMLVKAFSGISKEINDIKLVLVGPDDRYRSTLEDLIRTLDLDDYVVFTGFVTNDEKTAALVDADVFITPSFSGFPVTFLEACACGTPIITTNKGDELDWIQDKVGYVVEYDKDQLRDAIFKVLSDEGLKRRFGEEGRRLVREEFGWNEIVRKVEGLYKSLMEVQHL